MHHRPVVPLGNDQQGRGVAMGQALASLGTDDLLHDQHRPQLTAADGFAQEPACHAAILVGDEQQALRISVAASEYQADHRGQRQRQQEP